MPEAVTDRGFDDPPPLGWKTGAGVLGLYLACVAVATYPCVLTPHATLPGHVDAVQHLTVLRWYRTCLLEGRSPLSFPEIQYPAGATLGSFTPLHLQALLFVPLSLAVRNDILCYNVLWWTSFLLAGTGTFALARRLHGGFASAWFAGLLAMLGGPMMLRANGHLELMYIGLFPLFLLAWARFVDRPGRGGLFRASALYVLTAMAAAYFAVLAAVPAALYVAYGAAREGARSRAGWLARRAAWLLAFAGVSLPPLLLLFAGHLRNAAGGEPVSRPFAEFVKMGVPPWGYLVPTLHHAAGRAFGVEAYYSAGYPAVECASYLGAVTVALILYAVARRVGFRQAPIGWVAVAARVVLSFGAYVGVGRFRVPRPARWLGKGVFVFRLIRTPARFNLLAAVLAAVLASAGLRDLLGRLPTRKARGAVLGLLTALTVADLAMVPFQTGPLPQMPGCYAFLRGQGREMTLLELPLHGSGNADELSALCGYWQLAHRGRTTGGYSSLANESFDHQLVHNSPFSALAMAEPGYLADPGRSSFGIVRSRLSRLRLALHGSTA
ncbi:MAG: hypothetical protein U0835_13675 [Isosphaeraceae bacterium]